MLADTQGRGAPTLSDQPQPLEIARTQLAALLRDLPYDRATPAERAAVAHIAAQVAAADYLLDIATTVGDIASDLQCHIWHDQQR